MAPRTVATAVAFQSSTAVAGTGAASPPPPRGECPERASAVPAAKAIVSKATAVAAIIRQDRNIAPPPIIGEYLVRTPQPPGVTGDRTAGGSAGECSN